MDMNRDYGDGANPIILKSEFVLSLCEQLIGGHQLGAKEKSLIEAVPPLTLQDFRAELLKQAEPEAQDIALAIELFTSGSLNSSPSRPMST